MRSNAWCSGSCWRMGLFPKKGKSRLKCRPHHQRNRFTGNTSVCAVAGLKPIRKVLGALAGVAPDATTRDVLAGDDACVVDDVLPRGSLASICHVCGELDATVDTAPVALHHLTLQPVGNPPSVHRASSCRCASPCRLRPKLSNPAHVKQRLQPERDGRGRWSASLGVAGVCIKRSRLG